MKKITLFKKSFFIVAFMTTVMPFVTNNANVMAQITLSAEELQFLQVIDKKTISVACEDIWNATSNAGWVTVSPKESLGKTEVTITVARNTAEQGREATVTFASQKYSKILRIKQKGEPKLTEYVVINGVKWATRNVDAPGTFAKNPEDAGMLYQWNRKLGWSSTNPMVNSSGGTTWFGSNPAGSTWEADYDPSPVGYHVPTSAEINKLLDTQNVSREGRKLHGMTGVQFTDKTTGAFIFLPAAGLRQMVNNGKLECDGIFCSGHYWSSTSYGSNSARRLNIHKIFDFNGYAYSRGEAASVRCVADAQTKNGVVKSATSQAQTTATTLGNTDNEKEKSVNKGNNDNSNEDNSIDEASFTDIGVEINGVTWATRNVDASGRFAKNPEDAGMYYKLAPGFNASPAGYRLPTLYEINKLLDTDKVSNEWTTINGVKGRKFTDKTTNAFIFLPAAGYISHTWGGSSNGSKGRYLCSTPASARITVPRHNFFHFDKSKTKVSIEVYYEDVASEYSVRCVAK